jgi:hypothetical protein
MMSALFLARAAVILALTLNVMRGMAIPLPPESSHEWMAISIVLVLAILEAVAFLALASVRRSAAGFVYVLGVLGLLAVVTHVPMLVHMLRDNEPVTFFAQALIEGSALALAAGLKWRHEHRPPPALPA